MIVGRNREERLALVIGTHRRLHLSRNFAFKPEFRLLARLQDGGTPYPLVAQVFHGVFPLPVRVVVGFNTGKVCALFRRYDDLLVEIIMRGIFKTKVNGRHTLKWDHRRLVVELVEFVLRPAAPAI